MVKSNITIQFLQKLARSLVVVFSYILFLASSTLASEFSAPASLRSNVDFWVLFFTHYGEMDSVYHHRSHPHLIYTALDYSHLKDKMPEHALNKHRESQGDNEKRRISDAIKSLAVNAGHPRTELEGRLAKLLSSLQYHGKYELASRFDQIRGQRGIKESYARGYVRSGKYLPAMEKIFKENGLPWELTRIPFVESSFDFNARSAVGATGIWQFMGSTGKRFMRIGSTIDERRDPIFATRAAARYLKEAKAKLGLWPLAVTSYNHGITGMMRAASAAGSRDLAVMIRKHESSTFKFASKNFYTSILAALEVEQNGAKYFPNLKRDAAWKFDEVRLGRAERLSRVSNLIGVNRAVLTELNPGLLSPITSDRVPLPQGLTFRVPYGKGRVLATAVKGSQVTWSSNSDVITSRPQEFPSGNFKTGEVIKEKPAVLLVDEAVHASAAVKPRTITAAPSKRVTRTVHVVRGGDTLTGISRRYRVPMLQIRRLNPNDTRRGLRPGMKLLIAK